MRRNKVYRWLLALWLLLIPCEYALCAYRPATLPSAWRTKPVLSSNIQTEYQFRSTSTCPLIVGCTSYTGTYTGTYTATNNPTASSSPRVRKGGYWIDGEYYETPDDPEKEQPIGVIDTPVGEPWILILLVGIYLFVSIRNKHSVYSIKEGAR